MAVEEIINSYCKKYDIPGMIVGIDNEKGCDYYAYGYSERKRKIKVGSETLFEIASLSKAFTALAILLLEGRGLLSLDDRISNYFKGIKLCLDQTKEDLTDKIFIRDLIYHTSGLGKETIAITALSNKMNWEDCVAKLNTYSLHSYPGEKYEYVSINYVLLAYIIECVTHDSFTNVLKKLFAELGLNNTYADRKEALATGRMSYGYKLMFYKNRKCRSYEHKTDLAAGYIISNITDMIRWGRIQQGLVDDISDEYRIAVAKSHKSNNIEDGENYKYAGGWKVHIREKRIMHTGNNPTFSSSIDIRLNKKSCIVVLMNVNSLATLELADDIYRDKTRIKKQGYSEGLNLILDKINSPIAIVVVLLILSMSFVPSFHLNLFWLIIFIGCGIYLLIQDLFIKLDKRSSFKVVVEWITGSVVWSSLLYVILLVLFCCRMILN